MSSGDRQINMMIRCSCFLVSLTFQFFIFVFSQLKNKLQTFENSKSENVYSSVTILSRLYPTSLLSIAKLSFRVQHFLNAFRSSILISFPFCCISNIHFSAMTTSVHQSPESSPSIFSDLSTAVKVYSSNLDHYWLK